MRKSLFLLGVVLFLLACKPAAQPAAPATAACSPPYHEYTPGDCCLDRDANGICDRDENATLGTIVINKTTEAAPAPVRERTIVAELLAKFHSNVTSYSFVKGTVHYFVYGDLVRIKEDRVLPLGFKFNNSIAAYITDVYVDRTAREAVGYCDSRTETAIMGKSNADRSVCRQLIDIPLKLPYDTYNPVLPEDWLARFANTIPTNIQENDQYVKETTGWKAVNPVLTFQDGKNEVILHYEIKTGLPIRVQVNEPIGTTIEQYDWFVHNSVKPEDVVYHPFTK